MNASFLIIDEYKGRAIAKKMGLKIVGILGILIEAKKINLIEKIEPILVDLVKKAGFRINPQLYLDILKKANEI